MMVSSLLRFKVVDFPNSVISPLAEIRTASSLFISPAKTSTILALVINNLLSAALIQGDCDWLATGGLKNTRDISAIS